MRNLCIIETFRKLTGTTNITTVTDTYFMISALTGNSSNLVASRSTEVIKTTLFDMDTIISTLRRKTGTMSR